MDLKRLAKKAAYEGIAKYDKAKADVKQFVDMARAEHRTRELDTQDIQRDLMRKYNLTEEEARPIAKRQYREDLKAQKEEVEQRKRESQQRRKDYDALMSNYRDEYVRVKSEQLQNILGISKEESELVAGYRFDNLPSDSAREDAYNEALSDDFFKFLEDDEDEDVIALKMFEEAEDDFEDQLEDGDSSEKH